MTLSLHGNVTNTFKTKYLRRVHSSEGTKEY